MPVGASGHANRHNFADLLESDVRNCRVVGKYRDFLYFCGAIENGRWVPTRTKTVFRYNRFLNTMYFVHDESEGAADYAYRR